MGVGEATTDSGPEWSDVQSLVRNLPLFIGLDESLLEAIVAQVEWFSLPGGTTLFESGDPPDALYLVVSGNLGAYRTSAEGHRRLVGNITAGETVGEMAVISGKPRNATVVALRDTELVRLPRAAFERLVLGHPQGLMRVTELLVQRLDATQRQVRGRRAIPRTFAIVPHDAQSHGATFATQFATHLERAGRTELVWSHRGAEQTSQWFHRVERSSDFVVYVCDPEATRWSKLCLRQADVVLLLAQVGTTPTDWPVLVACQAAGVPVPRAEIVLLHRDGVIPGTTTPWLELRPGLPHHHVRTTADIARIARLLTGRGLGIVLSGGGARGFAHLGVLRAIREAGVEIDAMGGTSIGAIIAAGAALEWPTEDLTSRMRRSFVETNPLNDYTLPFVSLVSGRKVTRLLKSEFAETRIEDVPVPFFCVSSNLSSGQLALHRRGELWRWLRAAVAIPGVLPPLVHGGELFVDGAAINNLPVDVMRDLGLGRVIGVDVGGEGAFTTDTIDSDVPPLWRMLAWVRGRKQPINILQILWRAGMINNASNRAARHELTDLLLQPPLERIDVLHWREFERAVAIGYEYARERLAEWQKTAKAPPQRPA